MACKVSVTATDGLGKHLKTVVVTGATFALTYDDRAKVYADLKHDFVGPNGEQPNIFTETTGT